MSCHGRSIKHGSGFMDGTIYCTKGCENWNRRLYFMIIKIVFLYPGGVWFSVSFTVMTSEKHFRSCWLTVAMYCDVRMIWFQYSSKLDRFQSYRSLLQSQVAFPTWETFYPLYYFYTFKRTHATWNHISFRSKEASHRCSISRMRIANTSLGVSIPR